MTPAKARKEAQRVAADWEAEQKEAFERQKAQQEGHKTDYTFGQFVDEVWVPLCVRDGSHRPSTIAMYTNILKVMRPHFEELLLSGICKSLTSSFSCTIFSDIVCLLLSNVCVVTSFYQSLQAMSSLICDFQFAQVIVHYQSTKCYSKKGIITLFEPSHHKKRRLGILPKAALFCFVLEYHLHGEAAAEEIGVRPNLVWWRRGESNPCPKAL